MKCRVIVQKENEVFTSSIRDGKDAALYSATVHMAKAKLYAQLIESIQWSLIFGKYDEAVTTLGNNGFTVTIEELNQ